MFRNVTMDQFADKLMGISAYLSTPVINATNLEGAYDFTINFSPVGMAGPIPGAEADAAGRRGRKAPGRRPWTQRSRTARSRCLRRSNSNWG